jgi:phosphohistidine phosphatase
VAKQLWLLRHGEAVPHGAKQDFDRELTPRGEHQARLAGRALARVGIEFTAVYTSPKIRARQTAELACEELGRSFEEASVLAAGFDREDALELLLLHDEGAAILLVGHEPDFSQVVHDLTGGRIDLKTGGIATVKVDSSPELLVLLRPREIETMAGDVTE